MADQSKVHKAEPLVKLIVANGRSIDVPTGEKRSVGTDTVTGLEITTGVCRKLKEGDEFEIAADEAEYLMRIGFAVRPSEYVPRAQTMNNNAFQPNVQGPSY